MADTVFARAGRKSRRRSWKRESKLSMADRHPRTTYNYTYDGPEARTELENHVKTELTYKLRATPAGGPCVQDQERRSEGPGATAPSCSQGEGRVDK